MLNIGLEIIRNHRQVLALLLLQFVEFTEDLLPLRLSLQSQDFLVVLLDRLPQVLVFCVDIYAVSASGGDGLDELVYFVEFVAVDLFVPPEVVFLEQEQVDSIHGVQVFFARLVYFL